MNNYSAMGGSKLRKDLADVVHSSLTSLHQIWCEIGLSKEEISTRHESIKRHVTELFAGMVNEENFLLTSTKSQVRQYTEEIKQLRTRLDIKPTKLDLATRKSGSLLSIRQELKSELDHLNGIADKWRISFEKIATRCKELSDSLGLPSHYLVDSYHDQFVPSPRDIGILNKHIDRLAEEEKRRSKEHSELESRIKNLQRELGLDPTSILSDSNKTKDTILQDEYLQHMKSILRDLASIKENRMRKLMDMKKTFEILRKMDEYGNHRVVDFDFNILHNSNILQIAKRLDEIAVEMEEKKRNFTSNTMEQTHLSQECGPQLRDRPLWKLRSRSVSDTTLPARCHSYTYQSRGAPYSKALQPFRFGLDNGNASRTKTTKVLSPIKSPERKSLKQSD